MKTKVTPVKQKGAVVGQVTIEVLETLDELLTKVKEDLGYVLGCYNRGNAVALQAQLREGTPGGGPKKSSMAFLEAGLSVLTPEEFAQFAGNIEALKTFVKSDPSVAARIAAKTA